MHKNYKIAVSLIMLLFSAVVNAENEDVDQQIVDFDLSGFSKDGQKTWDVQGKSADILSSVVNLNDVVAHFYTQDDEMILTADKGSLDKSSGFVHLEDNVVAVSSSGGELTSDSLDWDQTNQVISTDDIVNIKKDTLTSVSKGAKAQPDLSTVYLNEDVTVQIQEQKDLFSAEDAVQNKKQPIIITCDGPLVIEYDKNIATFNKNVHVVETQEKEIFCERMVIDFDFKNKKINQVKAFEDVKIINSGNISYSDEAVYTNDDQKITLIGRPKLIIYSEGDLNAAFGNQ